MASSMAAKVCCSAAALESLEQLANSSLPPLFLSCQAGLVLEADATFYFICLFILLSVKLKDVASHSSHYTPLYTHVNKKTDPGVRGVHIWLSCCIGTQQQNSTLG